MQDSTNEKRIMRRRGRPRKPEMENSTVRKPRALRLSDEEEKYISCNAQRCKMNFSEYCRKVLMNYKPSVPDTKFRDELIAARRDIVNFANNIKKLQTDRKGIDDDSKSKSRSAWQRLYDVCNAEKGCRVRL